MTPIFLKFIAFVNEVLQSNMSVDIKSAFTFSSASAKADKYEV